jgi:hypothetical protein
MMKIEQSPRATEYAPTASVNKNRSLAGGVALLLSGLVIALGVSVAAAGEASADYCAGVDAAISAHNNKQIDQTDPAEVAVYNSEADRIEAWAERCGYTITTSWT